MDNKYQKAKVKNLEQSLEFQKYNVKKRRRKRQTENKNINKNKQCHKNYKENTGTKLISNTKKHKLKIQSRVWNFRYTMLYKRRRERNREEQKKKKSQKLYKKKTIGTKLITYQKAIIKNLEQSLEFQKYNVKEKKKKTKTNKKKTSQKIIKYIYMKFAEEEKNRVFFFFFCKVLGYKGEN